MSTKLNTKFLEHETDKNYKKTRKVIRLFISIVILFIISVVIVKYINKKSIKYDANVNSGQSDKDDVNVNSGLSDNIEVLDNENLENSDIDNKELEKNDDKESNEYNPIVPESDIVLDDYFNDAVFIGDSRTEGFIISNSLSNAKSLTVKGLMVDTAFTRPAINMNGEKLTVMKALSKIKFKKVYIMLGINELGWAYEEVFIKKYAELIDYVKGLNSEAQIYIQSIIPVSYEKSSSDKIYNNKNINNFNKLILKMTKEKQVYYVNVEECLKDDEGNLPVGASTDGIHLKKEYSEKWYEYLKTHTVQDKVE